eukprot:2967292-Amphidinium_carterae.1
MLKRKYQNITTMINLLPAQARYAFVCFRLTRGFVAPLSILQDCRSSCVERTWTIGVVMAPSTSNSVSCASVPDYEVQAMATCDTARLHLKSLKAERERTIVARARDVGDDA